MNINLVGFDYMGSDTVSEIYRNLKALLATPEGTCAGDRNYGINIEYIDKSIGEEGNAMAVEIIEKIDIYEPRVELEDIETEMTDNGVRHKLYFIPADRETIEDEE